MEDDANTNDGSPIDAALFDYAATLLTGSGVTIDTLLNLPLGATSPASTTDPAQAPEPLPALWAGWSAAARHGAPTGTTLLPPLTPAAAHPSTTDRNGGDT